MNQKLKNRDTDTERYLQFELGHEAYAIHLLDVREVIPTPATTKLPKGPAHFLGIMNLRGQIISVVDLRLKLGVKPKVEGLEEAVVIVNLHDISIGLVVDNISKVLNISKDALSEVPEIRSQVNATYILGVFRQEERLTLLLDLSKILSIHEIKDISNQAA